MITAIVPRILALIIAAIMKAKERKAN